MRGGVSDACLGFAAVMLVLAPSVVSAQDYAYPTPPPQNAPPPPPPPEPPPPKVSEHRGLQGGVTIGVPVALDVDRDVVRPGADIQFFGGYDVGYAMFGVNLGVSWNPINFDQIPTVPPGSNFGRDPLTRLYIAPEVRVQVPNRTPIMPYLAMTFDANWWRINETEVRCGIWYCTELAVFRFTPGFTAKFGIAFRLKKGHHVDVGVKYSLSGPGDFFGERQQWVTPYIGYLAR